MNEVKKVIAIHENINWQDASRSSEIIMMIAEILGREDELIFGDSSSQ